MNDAGSPQNRWLIFTVYSRPTGLLPHFLRHYRDLGFTDCVMAVHRRCERSEVHHEAARVADLRVRMVPCYEGPHHAEKDAALINWLRVRWMQNPREWAAWADIDEFYEYPMSLGEIARLDPRWTAIIGHYIDQVAADGSLPPVDPARPLAEQFPVPIRLSRRLGCLDRKVMMFRGVRPLFAGHHAMRNGTPHPRKGVVRHYPFTRGVAEAIVERQAMRDATGSAPVSSALRRFLADWVKRGRINPELHRIEGPSASLNTP